MFHVTRQATNTPAIPDTRLLRFEANLAEGTFLIAATVHATAVHPYECAPNKAQNLASAMCLALDIPDRNAYDQRVFHVLPLFSDSPLYGQWVGGSPMGMESMQPPAAWSFEERLALMQENPTHYPLLQGELPRPPNEENQTSEMVCQAITQAITHVLGNDALVSMEVIPVKTALDMALDRAFGDFGGYG